HVRTDSVFFNDTATTEIYTLSLHDALPISHTNTHTHTHTHNKLNVLQARVRSEEHTSELQSHLNLVCRLLLETHTTRDTPSHATPPQHTAHTPLRPPCQS